MGKNSLIKATSKKKKTNKKDAAEEKPAAKSTSAAKPKTAKTAKTTKAKKTAAKSKSTAKSTAKAKKTVKAKTAKAGAKAKPVSIKDLISKKFEPLAADAPLYVPPPNATRVFSAPPFISSENQEEIDRIKTLLKNKYSVADLVAAAEKAAAEKAAAEKAAAEKAAAEKAAAEKAAAEKAAAEKAAAEKAAAEKAAAEKAAAEKAAAEKAAAEKAAAEKAAAEKAAAEKAAAEKAAAEKAAAEKAAAEKAAAEKAAAEKAAAEKAAAEKAAAEKAAAEKAAAEKAAAEKAAAEKAAAEKAAAEKAAAEKAAAEKAAAAVAPPAPVKKVAKPSDPQEKVMKVAVGVFALLIVYLALVSYGNSTTYTLKQGQSGVELWQGNFSPMGEEKVMVLPGAQMPDLMKSSGAKSDIFPFVVAYYLNQADAVYDVPGIPDFKSVEAYLDKARPYAVTSQLKKEIDIRQTSIDFTVLLNKAEIAINSGTPEGLEAAAGFLAQAEQLEIDALKSELVEKKIQTVAEMQAVFVTQKPSSEPTPPPADEAPAEHGGHGGH